MLNLSQLCDCGALPVAMRPTPGRCTGVIESLYTYFQEHQKNKTKLAISYATKNLDCIHTYIRAIHIPRQLCISQPSRSKGDMIAELVNLSTNSGCQP